MVKIISVSIKDDQKRWLKSHPDINVSGILQKEIEKRMENDGKF